MSEKTIDHESVREEHLAEVHQRAHWAYLFGVMLGATFLMLALIAWLGAAGS